MKKLLDQKEILEELPPDPLGTKEELTEAVNKEITNELLNAVIHETNYNHDDKEEVVEKASQIVVELMDEKQAIDQADNLSFVQKAEIEDKLEDKAFTKLVESNETIVHDKDLNETDELFIDLAHEEKAIEELNINPKAKIEIEKQLEDNLLGEVPAIEESDQALVGNQVKFQHLNEVKDAINTYMKEKENYQNLHFAPDVQKDLKKDLTENILKQVIEAHKDPQNNPGLKLITNEVLTKLNKAHSYVDDLKQVGIGKHHEEIENHLEFDALEDIAEAFEDVKDYKAKETEIKVETINEEKFKIMEEEKDLIKEPHSNINEEVVEDAIDNLDPGQSTIEEKKDTPESQAALIDDLMNTEIILNKAGNLTSSEKEAIDVNLEEKVANEIMLSETTKNKVRLNKDNKNGNKNEVSTNEEQNLDPDWNSSIGDDDIDEYEDEVKAGKKTIDDYELDPELDRSLEDEDIEDDDEDDDDLNESTDEYDLDPELDSSLEDEDIEDEELNETTVDYKSSVDWMSTTTEMPVDEDEDNEELMESDNADDTKGVDLLAEEITENSHNLIKRQILYYGDETDQQQSDIKVSNNTESSQSDNENIPLSKPELQNKLEKLNQLEELKTNLEKSYEFIELKAKTEDINELENIKTSIQQTSDVDENEVKKLNEEVLSKVLDISDQILNNSISIPYEVAIAKEIKDMKNDVDEDLKFVQNSDLSEDEKVKISEKIEDAIVEVAVKSINLAEEITENAHNVVKRQIPYYGDETYQQSDVKLSNNTESSTSDNENIPLSKQELQNELEKLNHLEELKTNLQKSYESIADVLEDETSDQAKQEALNNNVEKVINLQKIENDVILGDNPSYADRNRLEKLKNYFRAKGIDAGIENQITYLDNTDGNLENLEKLKSFLQEGNRTDVAPNSKTIDISTNQVSRVEF